MRPAPPKGELQPASGRHAKLPRGNPSPNGRKRTPQNMGGSHESENSRVKDYTCGSGGIHCNERQSSMGTGRGFAGSPLHEGNKMHQGGRMHDSSCTRYLFRIC